MPYSINLGEWNDVFVVPRSVVNKHLKLAKEDYIKVLLLLLSSAPNILNEKEISEKCNVSEHNVSDALLYWENCGVIKNIGDSFIPSKQDNEIKPDIKETEIIKTEAKPEKIHSVSKNVKIKTNEPIRLTSFEISQKINSTEELKWVVSEAEKMFGRFLTQSETAVIVSMFDYANIAADIIVMIIDYCVSIDKGNMRFVEKTAYSWIDKGIDTHSKVEEYITSLVTNRNNENLIKSLFGIWDRNLTTKQKEFITVWLEDWKFSIEMIKLAYEKCVDNTSKLNFSYINKILFNWFENKIKTPSQVEEHEKARQINEKRPSFDAKEFDDLSSYTVPSLSKKKK